MILDLLRNRCPSCRKGTVFRWPYAMNVHCPECGVKFEKEQGYFMGAMIVGYAAGALSVIPTVVYLVFVAEAEMSAVIFIPCLQLVVLNPLIFMYSRLAWMYVETRNS